MSLDVYLIEVKPTEVFESNITSNVAGMAAKLDIIEMLWYSYGLKANQLIAPLCIAIRCLEDNPEAYREKQISDNWGTVEQFTNWLRQLLDACIDHPNATFKSHS